MTHEAPKREGRHVHELIHLIQWQELGLEGFLVNLCDWALKVRISK